MGRTRARGGSGTTRMVLEALYDTTDPVVPGSKKSQVTEMETLVFPADLSQE